jgi:electron transport complex protein RnfG
VRNAVRLATVLLMICAVTSGLLALVYSATRTRIEANARLEAARLRAEALGGPGTTVEFSGPKEIGNLVCYEGTVDGKPVGTVFTVTTTKGYGGTIELLVGVDPTGQTITGVRIAEHSETPGLGANVVQVRPGEGGPWFLKQFRGLTPERISLKADGGPIDGITAATISSRAVTEAVREGFEEFVRAKRERTGAG